MKKLMVYAALALVVAMGSCSGDKGGDSVKATESSLTSKIENCTNPDSLKVYVEEVKSYAQKLVDEGKVSEAQEFLNKITPAVQEKAPGLAGTLETVKEAIAKIPGQAADELKDAAGDAVDQAQSAVTEAGQDAIDKVKGAAENVKEGAANVVNDAKEGAVDTYTQAKNKVQDAATSAAKEATNTINNAIGK